MGKALLWNSEFKGMQHETWYVQESSARSLRSLCASVTQSCPTLCDPWTVAHQAPLSMGFSRQEYWSGLPLPTPGDLPEPGIEPRSPALQADSLLFESEG